MKAFKFMLGLLAAVQITSAKVIYVDDDASAGGDGSSWSSAHKYLQDAIAVAEAGDELWVAEGTYKPDQGAGITEGNRTASFILTDGINLYGGFIGKETMRSPVGSFENTILSGEIDDNSSLWSLHVVSVNYYSKVSLNGFMITKGNANGNWEYSRGGGVFYFGYNHKGEGGTFTNCIFSNNSASGFGGAFYGDFATFDNCTFSKNQVTGDGYFFGYSGGGFSGQQGNFRNCHFIENLTLETSGYGGAVSVNNGIFENCLFAFNYSGQGGGLSGSGSFKNCIFFKNSAVRGGGIEGNGDFDNCIITHNSAEYSGGGVSLTGIDDSNFTNCTITKNSAELGGGINDLNFEESWSTHKNFFKNSILHGNFSNGTENHGFNGTFAPLIINEKQEIVAQYPGDPNAQEAIFSYKYFRNIFQGWTGNENAFSADPLFVNLDNPIGPDGIWFTADDGLRLRSGSPAINAGINSDLSPDSADLDNDENTSEFIPSDIAGYRRIRGSVVDLGAYEYGDELMPTAPQYSISAIASTGGTVSGGGTFNEDASVTLTATPSNSGYIFSGWSGDASGTTNPLTITADSDKTITANFSKDDGDDDGDGISNYEEIVTYGTSKSSNDSDGDGLTDKEETERGLNPNSSDKAIIDAVMELKGMKADNVTPIVNDWYYVPNRGWFWTSKDVYPYTYSVEDNDWMYFQSGNERPKFYRYKTKDWVTFE
jgi:uncharacterized repeat protein (TIGR02543 family)